MNKADFDDAMKNLSGLKTPEGIALSSDRNEFIKRYTIAIGGPDYGYGLKTEKGEIAIYQLEKDARRQEALLKTKGQDPHSLYDPSSPNFLGKPSNLQKYQVSMQDQLKFNPPSDWQFSVSRQQYRDPQGRIYDVNGKPVK